MIEIKADVREVERLLGHIELTLSLAERPYPIMERVADKAKAQTQHRIYAEKTDPEGRAWRPWSPGYAATRGPQHSLLIDTRALVEGIDGRGTGDRTAEVWAGVPYSGALQFGKYKRPFLGLSTDNAREIEDWLANALHNVAITGEVRL